MADAALDSFSFFLKPSVLTASGQEYIDITVEPGQVITFTHEQLHAKGPNTRTKVVYRLFAYIVCYEADYLNSEAYHVHLPEKRRECLLLAVTQLSASKKIRKGSETHPKKAKIR